MSEHEDDALYDLLFGRGDDDEDFHENSFQSEELRQPEFQTLIVSQLHRETQKAYCVSGTVYFETPYRGLEQFDFLADWIPKSQCSVTGDKARIPQWIVKSRWQDRNRIERTVNIRIPF